MKKILLLFSLICSLFAFSATIIVTNTNDAGPGSFRQAVADANMGDIIRFDQSLIAGGSDTILFATPVLINKGLFIKGVYNNTDTLYLSGGGVSKMIDIVMASSSTFPNVDMDSLVFINGYSATSGGALSYTSDYNPNARLYIRHCFFRDNTSSSGGAIYSLKTSGSGTGSNYTCNVTLEYSTFKNNSSTSTTSISGGGAVYIHRYSSTTGYAVGIDLDIISCNFLDNTASNKGGAVHTYTYAFAPPSTGFNSVNIESSSFIGNEAIDYGGGLYTYAWGNTDCDVHSNISTWNGNSTIGSGGACYVESTIQSLFTSDFSTFYGNTAFVDGSALYVKTNDTDQFDEARIEVYGSIFAANGGNVNYQNTIYQSAPNVPFSSACYNLFDFPQNHLQYYQEFIPTASDSFNQTIAQINLASVALNPNGTYTLIPNLGSVAIGAGPGPGGQAQNAPVLGTRDIGAAESAICDTVDIVQTASFCQGSSFDFYGTILTAPGVYTHSIITPGSCDSLVTLTLTQTTPVVPTISISANPGNTIMTGTPVTLTATYTNGGANPSFQWYANGSPVGPNSSSLVSSTLTNGVSINCEIISDATCVSPSTAASNTILFSVHPNNDEPCNAISLDVNPTCVTTYYANHIATTTPNVGPHTCATSSSRDIWFSFAAPNSGIAEIYTYAGTLLDAVMSVYQGDNCSSLFEVGCIDDDGTNQMPQGLVTGATPGTIYYIRVSSWGTTNAGNFGICVVDPGNPSGLEAISASSFSIYPNPSSGELNLTFNDHSEKKIRILSSIGTIVYENEVSTSNLTINLLNVEQGVYLVEVLENGTKTLRKVAISR